jgi:8-oxo-dGTP diphosphatase
MVRRIHLVLLRVFQRLPVRARRRVVRTLAPSFTVGAICVVERSDGRILLIRHSYRKRWGIPGGLLKRGEPAKAGARREVLEEVGLEVDLVGEPAVVVDPVPRRVDLIYRARPAKGTDPDAVGPQSPEVTEVGWFDPTMLPELQFETTGAIQALALASLHPAAVPIDRTRERLA